MDAVSLLSKPRMAFIKIALSITLLVIGPGVSKVDEMGTIPVRLKTPIVGFNPTIEFKLDGDVIDPDVSVPTAATAKFAAMVTPLPAELPPVSKIPLP